MVILRGMKKPLEKKLDRIFSEYIRRKETKDGWGRCVSCSAIRAYEELDCGHFINRRWRTTRWEEKNCHIQCRSCNRFNEGNGVGYTLYMLDRYGRQKVEYLQALSRETAKYTDFDGEMLIKMYKEKLKKLK